mmetsp:Transcript_89063/g.191113  ORF Transcript_89063/g.191113 Transcript_89063/m.191113 type:complete len:281 (+) Transcript_89063:71-913(+)
MQLVSCLLVCVCVCLMLPAAGLEFRSRVIKAPAASGELKTADSARILSFSVINDPFFDLLMFSVSRLLNTSFMDHFTLFCLDDVAMSRCRGHRLNHTTGMRCERTSETYDTYQGFKQGSFYEVGWMKLKLLQKALLSGNFDQVMVFDADVLFLSPPQWLDSDVDFMYQAEGARNFGINFGLTLWRNTNIVRETVAELLELLNHEDDMWDQDAVNSIVPNKLTTRPLNVTKYRSKCYGYGPDPARLISFQANCEDGVEHKMDVLMAANNAVEMAQVEREIR